MRQFVKKEHQDAIKKHHLDNMKIDLNNKTVKKTPTTLVSTNSIKDRRGEEQPTLFEIKSYRTMRASRVHAHSSSHSIHGTNTHANIHSSSRMTSNKSIKSSWDDGDDGDDDNHNHNHDNDQSGNENSKINVKKAAKSKEFSTNTINVESLDNNDNNDNNKNENNLDGNDDRALKNSDHDENNITPTPSSISGISAVLTNANHKKQKQSMVKILSLENNNSASKHGHGTSTTDGTNWTNGTSGGMKKSKSEHYTESKFFLSLKRDDSLRRDQRLRKQLASEQQALKKNRPKTAKNSKNHSHSHSLHGQNSKTPKAAIHRSQTTLKHHSKNNHIQRQISHKNDRGSIAGSSVIRTNTHTHGYIHTNSNSNSNSKVLRYSSMGRNGNMSIVPDEKVSDVSQAKVEKKLDKQENERGMQKEKAKDVEKREFEKNKEKSVQQVEVEQDKKHNEEKIENSKGSEKRKKHLNLTFEHDYANIRQDLDCKTITLDAIESCDVS